MSNQVILDTSILVRFFTRDDEKKAQKVKALLESKQQLVLIDAVAIELIFTLLKVYALHKLEIIKILQFLVSRPNIRSSLELKEAIVLFEEVQISFVDCLVIAHGRENQIASFDRRLLKQTSAKRVV
ncbi:MAG: PIN domain-containing protein [Patescibacteria group bacterium]